MSFRRVCILSPNQAFQFETHAQIPSCREHRHISRAKGEELIQQNIVYRDDRGDFVHTLEARWVGKGKRWLTFVHAREWKRMESASTTVMQLVPSGGAW